MGGHDGGGGGHDNSEEGLELHFDGLGGGFCSLGVVDGGDGGDDVDGSLRCEDE